MRNLVLLRDSIHQLGIDGEIVSVLCDNNSELLVLSNHGILGCYDMDTLDMHFMHDLSALRDDDEEEAMEESEDSTSINLNHELDRTWFLMTIVAESGTIVCVSHDGKIASLAGDPASGWRQSTPTLEGVIDTRIATAAWSPDQTRLVIATCGNTLLSMSTQWEALDEVPTDPRASDTACRISWRGDGEQFALLSYDAEDCALGAKVRIYSKELELVSTGRNVADGAAAALKGLGDAVAFATNGSLVACAQTRAPGKLQVAFIEKNGLRHGEFDVRLPVASSASWEVCSLHWDLASAVLAVSLWDNASNIGVVQLYYRGNYHWYLKQQWCATGLYCLGFDAESVGRLFLAERGVRNAIRVVDMTWDVTCSTGTDATVAVVDGDKLLLTPFGIAVVPPPMSQTQAHLCGPCRHVSFWEPAKSCVYATGMLSIQDSFRGLLLAAHCLDDNGTPMHPATLRRGPTSVWTLLLKDILGPAAECVRAVQACEPNLGQLRICLLLHTSIGDKIAAITVDVISGRCIDAPQLRTLPGAGYRLGAWPKGEAEADSVALMLIENENGSPCCCVVQVHLCTQESAVLEFRSTADFSDVGSDVSETHSLDDAHVAAAIADEELPSEKVLERLLLPEACVSCMVVNVALHSSGSEVVENVDLLTAPTYALLAIGLTTKNRLYCGETLVANGASSYGINRELDVLLYCSVGTAPQLHFIPLQALAHIDPTRGIDAEDQLRPDFYAACFAPRPLERGARLVASVPGEPRVVVQQPRGNLEAFEPRALLLARARKMMDEAALCADKLASSQMCDLEKGAKLYLQCLQLLRRQRIDLNLLVDYRPETFMSLAPELSRLCLQTSHDMLALLVTSLTTEDVTAAKYPIPLTYGQQQARATRGELWTGAEKPSYISTEKVNAICKCLRQPLLDALHAGRSTALQPALCTYARSNPPQLEEAIATVRAHALASLPAGTNSSAALAGAVGQAAIKYLAFLADGQQLFNAALSTCDFDAARAVARQCQMDPKVYLPLVESFEAPSRGSDVDSVVHAEVRMDVHAHLECRDGVLTWGACALRRRLRDCCGDNTLTAFDAARACHVVLTAVKQGNLFRSALPALSRVYNQTVSATAAQNRTSALEELSASLRSMLSTLRIAYGEDQLARSQPDYAEAVAAFLAAEPPALAQAIAAARQAGDWQMALGLASRHATVLQGQGRIDLTPKRIAADIVTELVANMEQASTFVDRDGTDVMEITHAGDNPAGDKVTQAAQMCFDYAHDVDGAVRLLLLARRYEQAAQFALRHGRTDMLMDDVATATMEAAEQFASDLHKRSTRVIQLNEILRTGPWADLALRLEAAMAAEPLLRKELAWLEAGGEAAALVKDEIAGSDSQSEFSVASAARSDLSFISALSGKSSASGTSTLSGSTTVSVLSDLQTGAEKEAKLRSKGSGSQFSIAGLDHTLLSRGTGQEDSVPTAKNAEHARRLAKKATKKALRDDNRVRSKDSLGFHDENRHAAELWACAQIPAFAALAAELCSVLILLSNVSALRLAGKLQRALDAYIQIVRDNPAPMAPMYPRAWLESKGMLHIRHFQDAVALAVADAKGDYNAVLSLNWQGPEAERAKIAAQKKRESESVKVVLSWWQTAARGITNWHDRLRRVVLDLEDDGHTTFNLTAPIQHACESKCN